MSPTTIDPDLIRAAVIERTVERVRQYHYRPALLKFFTGEGPAAMWVVEYAAADPVTFICSGEKLRAWRVEASTVKAVHPDDVDPGEVGRRTWERPVTGLCLNPGPDGTWTVYVNELEGPQYGTMIHFDVVPGEGRVTLRTKRAVLLMHGTLVG